MARASLRALEGLATPRLAWGHAYAYLVWAPSLGGGPRPRPRQTSLTSLPTGFVRPARGPGARPGEALRPGPLEPDA
eukprot:9363922-Lingulodinium_polyedra.AAC.1